MDSSRSLAFQTILDVLEDRSHLLALDNLSAIDRALYLELKNGVFREWKFLEYVLGLYTKKKPKKIPYAICALSAYSILFLTKIPAYAIFSEAKSLARLKKLSLPEEKFIHGVLKNIERNKGDLLEKRSQALAGLENGKVPSNEYEWAVLNANMQFAKNFRYAENPVRAIQTLLSFKLPWPLFGYEFAALNESGELHEITRDDLIANNLETRVQGRSSYLASQWYFEAILRCKKSEVTVLEMAAGKGGKLLAAIHFLLREGKHPKILRWIACDSSAHQLEILQKSVQPLLQKYAPWVKLELQICDFETAFPPQVSADCIFIDAPCSGYGTLAKNPEIIVKAFLGEKRASSMSLVQAKMIDAVKAFSHVDTSVVYSVCTLTEEETSEFLSSRLSLQKKRSLEVWPHDEKHEHHEGFFIVELSTV